MSSGFPQYSHSARQGDAGVNLVAKIVSDEFRWLFKRIHQEHDFGIDGQIDIISDDGSVTGQILAVQIKHGASYLKETNRWGYVYRGEVKHFNYLSNYPIPVIIIVCNPDSKECHWVHFEPHQVSMSAKGWAITIPFDNRLSISKPALLALVGKAVDNLGALKAYWELNEMMSDSSMILYIVDHDDIASNDVSLPRAFFDRLRISKELALKCQGKVELAFSGYDNDPRELFEIEQMRAYAKLLDKALPEMFFFLQTDKQADTLKVLASCVCDARGERVSVTAGEAVRIIIATDKLKAFIMSHWEGLNEFTEWLGMSEEENKRISLAVLNIFDFGTAKGEVIE